jgi:hypothetical protein
VSRGFALHEQEERKGKECAWMHRQGATIGTDYTVIWYEFRMLSENCRTSPQHHQTIRSTTDASKTFNEIPEKKKALTPYLKH